MNISKDGKTLYFSDEEIDQNTDGEKKIFVTKRINGKETHTKVPKRNLEKRDRITKNKTNNNERFDFSDEIVIGVNKKREKPKSGKHSNKSYPKKNKTKPKKNKEKKNKKIVGIIGTIFLVAIIIILALTAPIFNITNITVEGNNKVLSETIITLSEIKKGENIFKFNSTAGSNIKENRYIDQVNIKRKLPGSVVISVTEREVQYQINLINSYSYLDKQGYILENSTLRASVPNIVGLSITEEQLLKEKRLGTEDLEKLSHIAKITEAAKNIEIADYITEINVEKENDYFLYLQNENKKVYIGDTSNLTNKMLYVQKILEKEKEHSGSIFVNGDINSGFKPYFREE